MYLSFSDYETMGGKAEDIAFNRLSYRAEKMIDRYTQCRVRRMADTPEAVKRCVAELVDLFLANPMDESVKPALTGFSNDGYSESYSAPVAAEDLNRAYLRVIVTYLSGETDDNGTPLLYRGVDV